MARLALGLLLLVTVQCLWTSPAAAQDNCHSYVQYCPACGDPVLPGQYGCVTEGPFLSSCFLPAWYCVPGGAAQETCPTCNRVTAGAPIDLASGNTFIVETDTQIPGLGGGLSLARTWNSMWPAADSAYQTGIFGPNWRSTYEEILFVGSDHYTKYLRSDGSIWSFGYGFRPGVPSYATMPISAPASGGGGGGASISRINGKRPPYINFNAHPFDFTLFLSNGEQRLFNKLTGKLDGIIDRNGNTTGVSYDSNGHISNVHDAAGRHLYFHYGTSTMALVTSITTDFGVTLYYSYDSQGRLTQVTEPDSSTISFQYDTNGLISSVLDSNGHVLETHTYDSSGRGLSSSRANGVDAVTINY